MSSIHRITIEGEFTIFGAQAIKEQLLDAFDEGQEIEVDLSHVSEIDSAGLQLMLASKLEAGIRGKTLRFADHSTVVASVLDFCNLSGYFSAPALIPEQ